MLRKFPILAVGNHKSRREEGNASSFPFFADHVKFGMSHGFQTGRIFTLTSMRIHHAYFPCVFSSIVFLTCLGKIEATLLARYVTGKWAKILTDIIEKSPKMLLIPCGYGSISLRSISMARRTGVLIR